MNVSLPPELEKLVRRKLESGRYQDAGEVVGEALRAMEQYDELRQLMLQRLRKELQKGEEDYSSGNVTFLETDSDLDEFFARL